MLREHVAETRALIDEWQTNRERITRFEQELYPLGRERIDAAISVYRGGKASLGELLAARQNEISVRIQSPQYSGRGSSSGAPESDDCSCHCRWTGADHGRLWHRFGSHAADRRTDGRRHDYGAAVIDVCGPRCLSVIAQTATVGFN